jgi:pyridoxine/pyridoxamine 5'-phosphate oxidase
MRAPGGEVDVVPSQCHQLRGPEAVAVSDQDSRGVPMPRAVLLGDLVVKGSKRE